MRIFEPYCKPLKLWRLSPNLWRSRPRHFEEWAALRRWGQLPYWEPEPAGYLLRTAREEAGLTQAELGARLGVTQQAVARAERWDANPTIERMRRWSGACGRIVTLQLDPSPSEVTAPAAPGI